MIGRGCDDDPAIAALAIGEQALAVEPSGTRRRKSATVMAAGTAVQSVRMIRPAVSVSSSGQMSRGLRDSSRANAGARSRL